MLKNAPTPRCSTRSQACTSLMPADPWPRHQEESGASIAVCAGAYRRAGGMPPAPLAEDRAFFAALRRIDARIRHAPEVSVVVSGRILGRAAGGMADTIRRRLMTPDSWLDPRLEPAADRMRRLALRAARRDAWRTRPAAATLAANARPVSPMRSRPCSPARGSAPRGRRSRRPARCCSCGPWRSRTCRAKLHARGGFARHSGAPRIERTTRRARPPNGPEAGPPAPCQQYARDDL